MSFENRKILDTTVGRDLRLNVVSSVTIIRAGRSGARIRETATHFSPLHTVHTGFGAHPLFSPMDTAVLSRG